MILGMLKMTNLFRAIIIGAPGSGKGTISSRIVKNFDLKHISSGDALRFHMLKNTDLGKKASKHIEKGQLVPDALMIKLMINELSDSSADNWLLDGYPRTKFQAEELFKREPINVALNLVVPFSVIVERIQGRWIHPASGRVYNTEFSPPKVKGKDDVTGEDLIRRPDDQPEAVRNRLEIYSRTVDPLLHFYNDLGILKNFHGKTSDEIWPQVFSYMSLYIKPKLRMNISN